MEKIIKLSDKLQKDINRYEFLLDELYKFENEEIKDKDFRYKEEISIERDALNNEIKILLKKILKYSNKYLFYFSDCSKETYLKTISKRYEAYKKKNEGDLPELYDFLMDEIKFLKNKARRHTIGFENNIVDYTSIWESLFEFKVNVGRKLDVLSSYVSKIEKSNKEFYLDDNGLLIETSRSGLIIRKIHEHLKDLKNFEEIYESELDYLFNKDLDTVSADFKMHSKLESVKYYVTEYLKMLYKQSVKDNYFFFDCPLKVYINHYEDRKNEFLEENIDAVEADFLKKELNRLIDPHKERILTINDETYEYDGLFEYIEFISITNNKKIEYLKTLLINLGWDSIFTEIEDGKGFYDFEKNENYKNDFLIKIENNFDISKDKDVLSENNTVNTDEKNLKLLNKNKTYPQKIKWTAGPSTLGFIIAKLAEYDYIDFPKKRDNEINYSAFAKQVLNTFEIDSTEHTLQKYLNLSSEKGQEKSQKFKERSFYLPHSREL